jgi:hypothetical protein
LTTDTGTHAYTPLTHSQKRLPAYDSKTILVPQVGKSNQHKLEIVKLKSVIERMFSNPTRSRFLRQGLEDLDLKTERVTEFNQTPYAKNMWQYSRSMSTTKEKVQLRVGDFIHTHRDYVFRISGFKHEEGQWDGTAEKYKTRTTLSKVQREIEKDISVLLTKQKVS